MNRITEKQYNERKAEIKAGIKLFNRIQDDYISIASNEVNDQSIKDQYGLLLNTIDDALYILKKELNELEDKWDTRDWTYSDYTSYNLAVNNID